MTADQVLNLITALLAGALVAGLGVFLWARGQIKDLQARIDKLNHARQLAAEQVTQARRQIEQIQRENNVLKLAAKHHPPAAPAEPAAAPAPVDAAEAARLYVESKLRPAEPEPTPDPFADTLVLRHGKV